MKPCLTLLLLAALLTRMAPGMVFLQKESAFCTLQIDPALNTRFVGQPGTFGVQDSFQFLSCTWTFGPNAFPQKIPRIRLHFVSRPGGITSRDEAGWGCPSLPLKIQSFTFA